MNKLRRTEAYYAVELPGFDGGTDTTDAKILWVKASSVDAVKSKYPDAVAIDELDFTPGKDTIDAVLESYKRNRKIKEDTDVEVRKTPEGKWVVCNARGAQLDGPFDTEDEAKGVADTYREGMEESKKSMRTEGVTLSDEAREEFEHAAIPGGFPRSVVVVAQYVLDNNKAPDEVPEGVIDELIDANYHAAADFLQGVSESRRRTFHKFRLESFNPKDMAFSGCPTVYSRGEGFPAGALIYSTDLDDDTPFHAVVWKTEDDYLSDEGYRTYDKLSDALGYLANNGVDVDGSDLKQFSDHVKTKFGAKIESRRSRNSGSFVIEDKVDRLTAIMAVGDFLSSTLATDEVKNRLAQILKLRGNVGVSFEDAYAALNVLSDDDLTELYNYALTNGMPQVDMSMAANAAEAPADSSVTVG